VESHTKQFLISLGKNPISRTENLSSCSCERSRRLTA